MRAPKKAKSPAVTKPAGNEGSQTKEKNQAKPEDAQERLRYSVAIVGRDSLRLIPEAIRLRTNP